LAFEKSNAAASVAQTAEYDLGVPIDKKSTSREVLAMQQMRVQMIATSMKGFPPR